MAPCSHPHSLAVWPAARHRRLALCIFLLLLQLAARDGRADTGDILVRVIVEGGCTIVDSGELDFGVLNPASGNPATATGTVSYWCAKGTPYSIQLGNGENYDAGKGLRQMVQEGGSGTLPYALQEPPGNPYIGNGPTPPDTFQMVATVRAEDVRNAAAAAYRDNLVITIEP